MAYPKVNIINTTPYPVSGSVTYLSGLFCSPDSFTIEPHGTWQAGSRGVCLVTSVNASVKTPEGSIPAERYTSSGTSYSKFAVIQTGDKSFEVTRRVSGSEDHPPADYAEPTEKQK